MMLHNVMLHNMLLHDMLLHNRCYMRCISSHYSNTINPPPREFLFFGIFRFEEAGEKGKREKREEREKGNFAFPGRGFSREVTFVTPLETERCRKGSRNSG